MATAPVVIAETPVRTFSSGWTPARRALALTIGLRFFYSAVAAIFAPQLVLSERLIRSNGLTDSVMSRTLHPVLYSILGVWERFDTLWYIDISRHGYASAKATVFYPLYPALIRVVSQIVRSDLVAALLISTAATFFLILGALQLFEEDYGSSTALRSILLWCLWPAAFTFFAGYPDSLLCALIVWSLLLGGSGRWLPAGILGLLAGFCKAMGCLVALPLFWMAWKQRERRGMTAALLPLAGIAFFQIWLALFHFPSASEVYRAHWATATVAPWITLRDALAAAPHFDVKLWLNLGVLLVVGAGAMLPSVRAGYKLYAAAAICLFLTKHTATLLESTTRYSLAVFAAYPALAAKLGRGISFVMVVVLAGTLNLLLFRAFLDWGLVV